MNLLNMLPSLTPISLMPARQRSGTGTTNGTGQDVSNLEGSAIAILDVTAESGTSPTLDVKLQESDTVGGTYTDVALGAFTQVTTVSGLQKLAVDVTITKKFLRGAGTAGGTSPVYGWGLQLLGVKKY